MTAQSITHYRILSKLGAGGMGEVYLAEDIHLGRKVAIKFLPPESTSDSQAKRRLIREAQAAAKLDHQNICSIYEVAEENGASFIVMQYIEGETLASRIQRQPLEWREALEIATPVADALAEAHACGIIHRDIKPQNIMITSRNQVKVMDFGLAKVIQDKSQPDSEATTKSLLTAAGVIVGTAAYMSPEQASGASLDARSDIFSFGAVMYEMVAGEQAFQGNSAMATLAAVLSQEPKPLPAKVPPELSKIILRCLRKDTAQRYQTMAELKVALEEVRQDSSTGRRRRISAPLRWRWTWSLWPILLVTATLLGFFAWRTWRAPASTEPLKAEALTTMPGQELYPSVSPDGERIAFTWTGQKQDNTDIYVQQIGAAGTPFRLTTDSRNDYNPVWSPDGRWIAFLRGDPATPLARSIRELRLIAPLGGPERTLGEVSVQEITENPVYLTWCADSKCLIVTDSVTEGQPDALFVVSIDTGEKRQLTSPQPPVVADTNPSLAPDGKSLLFLRRTTWARGELHVLPLRSDMTAAGEPKHIEVSRLLPETATWTPNGDEILFATTPNAGGASLWRVSATGGGQPARVPFVGEDGVMPAVSRPTQGKLARLVYVRSFTDENIWRIDISAPGDAASSASVMAIASTKADIHPQVSPDGRRVAFTSTRSGAWEIWVADSDGSNPVQITSLKAPTGTGAPHWSPDGRRIVFASDAEGQFDIFTVPPSGGQPRNITSHPAFDHVPTFSRDGQWIYFSSTRSGQYQVWKMPAEGGEAVQITKDGGWLPQESLDGMYLYITPTAAIGAPTQLWRMPTSGGQAVKVVDNMRNTTFTVLERGIYYISQTSGEMQLRFFNFTSQKSVTVARDLGAFADVGGLAASPDGRTILYARRDSAVDDLMLVENFR